MNGGAVKDERSPEKDAMDLRKALHDPLFCADTPAPSFSLEDISCVALWLCGLPRETIAVVSSKNCTLRFNVLVMSILCSRECVDEYLDL